MSDELDQELELEEPAAPFCYQSIGGAAVFFPGRVYIASPPPLEEKRRRCCPRCGRRAAGSDRTGSSSSHYVFACQACISPETLGPTVWREEKGA